MRKYSKLIVVAAVVAIMFTVTAISCFAEGTTAAVDDVTSITTGITTIFNSVASNFSFTNIVTFLGIAIGSASLIALGWFGLRKVVAMIQTALKKGKVRI